MGVLALINACSAVVTSIRYQDLDVQTQLSNTIFLKPAPPQKKSVWVEVKDTSGEGVDLAGIKGLLTTKGYKLTDDPDAANYRMQLSVRFMGKAEIPAIKEAVHAGFGGPLTGMVVGGVIGGTTSGSALAPLAGAGVGGLLGYGAELIGGELVKKVTYCMVVDVQLSEKSDRPVSERQSADLQQGVGTKVQQQTAPEKTDWLLYQTRMAASATQANLAIEAARPALVEKLTKSLAGIL